MAKGLDAARLRRHWKAIEKHVSHDSMASACCAALNSTSSKTGSSICPIRCLAEADWVVASIHYGQNQSEKQITRRMINAIRSPHVDAIGHPTGRLIGKRKAVRDQLETKCSKAAADYGCMMELNCQPSRLDLDEIALSAAKQGTEFRSFWGPTPTRPMSCVSWSLESTKPAAQGSKRSTSPTRGRWHSSGGY